MAVGIHTKDNMFDFVIIGAGMAGASAAYFLAAKGSVLLLEMETQPGYHTTGRSAALFSESYGNAPIRALTSAGREFLVEPPDGFAEMPVLKPRGALFIGREDQLESLNNIYTEGRKLIDSMQLLSEVEVRDLVPVFRDGYIASGVFESEAMDIDVNVLHQGFLRGARLSGAHLKLNARVTNMDRENSLWRIYVDTDEVFAKVVINAAGAWCDSISEMVGGTCIGLVPKRRTAILFNGPSDMSFHNWPAFIDADEKFYARPEGGVLMGSPADETPIVPCDVQPEELDIAIAIDRLEEATTLRIQRVIRSWAGLRSFVPDKTPVVGFDPKVEDFFWLAGQGGYGIQTSPSMGRVAAALAIGDSLPHEISKFGISAKELSPERLVF